MLTWNHYDMHSDKNKTNKKHKSNSKKKIRNKTGEFYVL